MVKSPQSLQWPLIGLVLFALSNGAYAHGLGMISRPAGLGGLALGALAGVVTALLRKPLASSLGFTAAAYLLVGVVAALIWEPSVLAIGFVLIVAAVVGLVPMAVAFMLTEAVTRAVLNLLTHRGTNE